MLFLHAHLGRDRWVYYIRRDYDASQVAPEWYICIHCSPDFLKLLLFMYVYVSSCLCLHPRAFINVLFTDNIYTHAHTH